jgi:uncharacterized protein YuzE
MKRKFVYNHNVLLFMKMTYQKFGDLLYIKAKKAKIFKTVPISEDIVVDVDKKGGIVGIEILFVSKHVPKKLIDSAEKLPNKFITVEV